VLALACADARAECPPLNALYPAAEAEWPARRPEIEALMPECLESAEYFALLGAARLNTNDLPGALEALERALLIDPGHGGAQIDYAEALYRSGQLFAALELNRSLLARTDLPPDLQPVLRARQTTWNRERRLFSVLAELSAGYDTNLNGAPSASEFMLTLSGESVPATLDPEFQPKEGAFGNARIVGSYAVVGSEDRHDLLVSLRNRSSNYSSTDLIQFDWRYGYTRDFTSLGSSPLGWEITAGTSHLLFGGSPLYSVLDMRNRFVLRHESGCSPLVEVAGQYQRYHGQNIVSGVESSLSGGLQCKSPSGRSQLELEGGYLKNEATEALRPGGDREGWRFQVRWQYQLRQGSLDVDAAYARLDDDSGYSPVLDNGAERSIDNYQLRLQYQRPLNLNTRFFTGLNYQNQNSNLAPFRNEGTALEAGLRYQF
jgi:tetratricopeptide (TPR) repeat protein